MPKRRVLHVGQSYRLGQAVLLGRHKKKEKMPRATGSCVVDPEAHLGSPSDERDRVGGHSLLGIFKRDLGQIGSTRCGCVLLRLGPSRPSDHRPCASDGVYFLLDF
ncbi:hypothetical protein TW95_gp0664 [Pandoravirus inopinatum]|uniref:Uncharacterized protein n=1 Tax=Pandoravirus inopinatum TaxID=1605721 RepID=A0A0B5IXC1_9VIRU|nr:hypothetical protein TW95_gp0664 [Pandoravirus inopinatum]AJF97398.1 hypothetical protein [Pandoravirus inopinatum]